jgi:hypothetical protein
VARYPSRSVPVGMTTPAAIAADIAAGAACGCGGSGGGCASSLSKCAHSAGGGSRGGDAGVASVTTTAWCCGDANAADADACVPGEDEGRGDVWCGRERWGGRGGGRS